MERNLRNDPIRYPNNQIEIERADAYSVDHGGSCLAEPYSKSKLLTAESVPAWRA